MICGPEIFGYLYVYELTCLFPVIGVVVVMVKLLL